MAAICFAAILAPLAAFAQSADQMPLPRPRPGSAAQVAPTEQAAAAPQSPFRSLFKPRAPAAGKSSKFDSSSRKRSPTSAPSSPASAPWKASSSSSAPRRTVRGHLLHSASRQDPLSLQAARPARRHRRRTPGRGARHARHDAGPLPTVQDAAPLPARREHRSDLGSSRPPGPPGARSDAVVIVEKTAFSDGKLTLVFDPKTYELKQWIVTDAQGLNTSVAIYNVTTGKPQDPKLFRSPTTSRADPVSRFAARVLNSRNRVPSFFPERAAHFGSAPRLAEGSSSRRFRPV